MKPTGVRGPFKVRTHVVGKVFPEGFVEATSPGSGRLADNNKCVFPEFGEFANHYRCSPLQSED